MAGCHALRTRPPSPPIPFGITNRWKKTLIVVSHDRDFLNTVTTDIIHLHDERLHYYRGNFAQFEEMYEQRRREVNKEFDKYQKQMKAAKRSGRVWSLLVEVFLQCERLLIP